MADETIWITDAYEGSDVEIGFIHEETEESMLINMLKGRDSSGCLGINGGTHFTAEEFVRFANVVHRIAETVDYNGDLEA